MDAYSKAKTLHQDLSLGNIILYTVPGLGVRVGYLIDWELGCRVDEQAVWCHAPVVGPNPSPPPASPNNLLKGTPAFMSITVANAETPYVHSLEDDLESLLYVILYCALRWLPVDSPQSGLDWWITQFFGNPPGWPPAAAKEHNSLNRAHTRHLKSTGSQAILDWLNAAMDLHHGHPPFGPNPLWKGGEALQALWMETLAKVLPEDDRHENPVLNITYQEALSPHATYTTGATSAALLDSHNPTIAKWSTSDISLTNHDSGMFGRHSNRRQRGSDSEGEVETRSEKLRRTGPWTTRSPSLLPAPQQTPLPLSTERRVTRSSTRRFTGKKGTALTVAHTPTLRRSTRSGAKKK